MTRFVKNPHGIGELAKSAGLDAARRVVGEAVIERAASISPSHVFAERLEVLDSHDDVLSVGTKWSLGHIIEWGSVNNPPYAPLRRAVTGLGLKFEED